MSKEREILQKILATNWLDYQLSCEVKELLAQPEQEGVPSELWQEASTNNLNDN